MFNIWAHRAMKAAIQYRSDTYCTSMRLVTNPVLRIALVLMFFFDVRRDFVLY